AQYRNLYTALEYLKLRPVVYPHVVWAFKKSNQAWLQIFLPNLSLEEPNKQKPSRFQQILEKIFVNGFGQWLEKQLKNWQLAKIKKQKFIVVEEDELSFHPDSKQQSLLADFFKF